jgi:hypothetical protein
MLTLCGIGPFTTDRSTLRTEARFSDTPPLKRLGCRRDDRYGHLLPEVDKQAVAKLEVMRSATRWQ